MLGHEECLEKMKTLRRLRDMRAEIDKQSADIKKEEAVLNAEITEYFEHVGTQSMDIDGYGKFYLNREIYPSISDQDAVRNWLETKGDLDLIMTFNTNKFKAYYKELVENNGELPPSCEQFVKTEIRMRRN